MNRVYLDYNASAPLREEAREAMVHTMALAGNPSSVHAEGRQARAIVETARQQVAAAQDLDRQLLFDFGEIAVELSTQFDQQEIIGKFNGDLGERRGRVAGGQQCGGQ